MAESTLSVPQSSVTGIVWPSLPDRDSARVLALLYQMEQSEWWTPESIRTAQFRQLRALAAHAVATVPFYRRRLGRFVDPDSDFAAAEDWHRIPILTREEVQEAGDALESGQVPSAHGTSYTSVTSGSTGRPVSVRTTTHALAFARAARLRGNHWHRRDYAGKVASIQRLNDELRSLMESGKRAGWAAGYASGPMIYRDVEGPLDDHLAWIAAEKPDYLIAYPTLARALAERSLETGFVPSGLREVNTQGEVVDESVRDACRRAWNVPVIDIYSAREVEVIAIQCPAEEHHHILSETVLVEIVDESGASCHPGEVGRVVVTPLHNFATPLIRYHLGDYAEAGGPCPCGRGLPVIRRILGRTRNMLTLPNGDRVFPRIDGRAFSEVTPLRQFQLVQRRPDEIEARLVTSRPLDESELNRLRTVVAEGFGHPFPLRVEYVDEIPRSPGGKYEDFRSEITG